MPKYLFFVESERNLLEARPKTSSRRHGDLNNTEPSQLSEEEELEVLPRETAPLDDRRGWLLPAKGA